VFLDTISFHCRFGIRGYLVLPRKVVILINPQQIPWQLCYLFIPKNFGHFNLNALFYFDVLRAAILKQSVSVSIGIIFNLPKIDYQSNKLRRNR